MRPVARAGDASATASTAKSYPNDTSPTATGQWKTAGPVSETPVAGAQSDGKKIITSAACSFVFTGNLTSPGNLSFTSPPSKVTLTPASRILKAGGSDPLVDGDEAADTFGNKVSVSSTATWQTV